MKRMSRVEWDAELRRCAEAAARAKQVHEDDKRQIEEIADDLIRRVVTPREFFAGS